MPKNSTSGCLPGVLQRLLLDVVRRRVGQQLVQRDDVARNLRRRIQRWLFRTLMTTGSLFLGNDSSGGPSWNWLFTGSFPTVWKSLSGTLYLWPCPPQPQPPPPSQRPIYPVNSASLCTMQPGGPVRQPYSYSVRSPHRYSSSKIPPPRNRFLGSLKV